MESSDPRRFEHVVCSLTGGDDFADILEQKGAVIHFINKKGKLDLGAARKIAAIIDRERVDILHLHNASASFWGLLAVKLGRTRLPIVRTEHSPLSPLVSPWFYKVMYPYIARNTNVTVCVSEDAKSSFLKRVPDLSSRFVTIHNGIDTSLFLGEKNTTSARNSFGLPQDVPLAGTVGRLVSVKNQTMLLDAFAIAINRVPSAHLAILGDGPLLKPLKERSRALSIEEHVHFITKTDEMPSFYHALDLFVLSSQIEGLPMTVLEALCSGVPVVSTKVGGIPEAVIDGATGHLVDRDDAAGLAGYVADLLSDPVLRARMGEKGREHVAERFDIKETASRYEEIYERLAR